MEGLLDACNQACLALNSECVATHLYARECLLLGRYTAKVALVMAEVGLQLRADESLRGAWGGGGGLRRKGG